MAATLNALFAGPAFHLAIYIGMIVFFAFFYTAIVFNPEDTSENLRNMAATPDRPQVYSRLSDFVLTRLTVLGAAYLAAVCILPEI